MSDVPPTAAAARAPLWKRAYRPVHVNSWTIMLNKDGYVRCHLQYCRYIAYRVDDMKRHFQTCRGDAAGDFACATCGGQTASAAALDHHRRNYHRAAVKPAADPRRFASWTADIAARGYAQCAMPDCHYIGEKVAELERHYATCPGVDPDTAFKYSCRHCQGYTVSQQALQFHQRRHHRDRLFPVKQETDKDLDKNNGFKSYPMGQYGKLLPNAINADSKMVTCSGYSQSQINDDYESLCSEVNANIPTDDQIHFWTVELKNGYTHCNHNSCKYMAFDMNDMKDHFATCFIPYLDREFECSICGGRTMSSNKVKNHLLYHHDEGYKLLTEEECGFKIIKTETGLEIQTVNKEPVVKRKSDEVDEEKHLSKRKSYYIPKSLLVKWRQDLWHNKFIRCTAQDCSYLALDMLEMKQHSDEHLDSVNGLHKEGLEDNVTNFCDYCRGRFKTAKHLEGHKLVLHSSDVANINCFQVNTEENKLDYEGSIDEIL